MKLAIYAGLRPEGWRPPAPIGPPPTLPVEHPRDRPSRPHTLLGEALAQTTKRTAKRGGGRCPKAIFVRYLTLILFRRGTSVSEIKTRLEYRSERAVRQVVRVNANVRDEQIRQWLTERKVYSWQGVPL